MNHMLFFGSLKKKGFNFNRFGGQTYIKNINLDGFEMYNLGPYPAICKGDGIIKCELHAVKDKAFGAICRMEHGAGYQELTINLDDQIATIFVMDKKDLKLCPRIKSGNWTDIKRRKFQFEL